MSESSNYPAGERTSISEAVTTTLRQPSFLRVMLVLAATVVVLVGLRLGAPILNPILFAVVLTLLFSPVYSWLLRRGLPAPLALLGMLVLLTVLFLGLIFILGVSISRFTERVGFYTTQLNGQVDSLDALLERLGLSNVDVRDVVKPGALTDALGAILSGIAGFLSDFFLILVIMLFLLGEGPAMMNRLRASASSDNPQVARLTTVGQAVVLQFGLRAIVNLATGAGVSILLFVLGVDFPLLWGILTFFLSFVPYIGLVLAVTPAVVLALAEFGLSRAVLVIAGIVVINILAENVLSPMMMGRGLNISPTIVFLSFIFWAWLLGARCVPGASHHPVCGGHVRHLPGDALACEPHRRGWRGHRCCGRYSTRRAYHGYGVGRSCAVTDAIALSEREDPEGGLSLFTQPRRRRILRTSP